jgi:fused signal recognition particle receptor
MGIFDKGVKKTNRSFFDRLSHAVIGRTEVDEDVLDAIEEALIATDMGVDTTMKIIDSLEERVSRDKYISMNELVDMLREEIADLLDVDNSEKVVPFDFSKKPYVIMVVGVNGVGKTTTIGKLANKFVKEKKKVTIAAADTFRAAASDQLTVWAERAKVRIIKHPEGADASAVVFDAITSAKSQKTDVLL